ncbi:UDP-2,3-diacylglucosamine diphosphatase [Thermoflexibacter ruber]|uniref:UDP-2,3-diacylglucosamine pyrophosphatase LpxH n=1 Tax=Thermoflexibacter ruber TaxID=1003 RepID=A0A1I2F5Q8_9BACT|nr:UDP-2,3-diacylglucosamine diphosphatase [Thermoflexibacter ruber]SFF00167.1 UDP-2,3-diacylglucosamine pyrophosphatase LpxH [Thermoflexibacter ruber]
MNNEKVRKRKPEIVVISDVHLGTFGCRAEELLDYLRSIKPKMLILNGDIIDIWRFSRRYWGKAHNEIIRRILKLMIKGTQVYYITGNHDELLRRFPEFHAGNFHLVNKLVLNVDGKKVWLFHGDIFDVSITHAKWLAKLGSIGYDLLIMMNSFCNFFLTWFGYHKMSFSKKIKNSVKGAIKYISDFEQVAAELAIDRQYDYLACGHIHQPVIRDISNHKGEVTYLNSGDWVENMTSLEYEKGEWKIFQYEYKKKQQVADTTPVPVQVEIREQEMVAA